MKSSRDKIMDEMVLAKSLASNNVTERQKALAKLEQWISNQKEDFSEEDFMRLWKGLFYCMWMSDKPLVQEELAEEISRFIHVFSSFDSSLLFMRCFFLTMAVEWVGIDHHRLDKFMMLVRRFLRQSFVLCSKKKWAKEEVDKFAAEFFNILKFLKNGPLGLITHVKDLYVEELVKVSGGKMASERAATLLEPFARFVAVTDNSIHYKLAQRVFSHIIKQSEHGLEHSLKVRAWKKMGFPPRKFKKIKRVSREADEDSSDADIVNDKSDSEIDEGEDEVSQFQDLRAGGDLIMPTLDFDALVMIDMLERVKNDEQSTKSGKGRIQAIKQLFQRLKKGQYPLITNQIRSVDSRQLINLNNEVETATSRLQEIHNLKDDEVVNHYYALKNQTAPKDDILLAGSGKRKREWVEKADYNNSVYLFGQANHSQTDLSESSPGQTNRVKNQSGVWTVTPKADNGVSNSCTKGKKSLKKKIETNSNDVGVNSKTGKKEKIGKSMKKKKSLESSTSENSVKKRKSVESSTSEGSAKKRKSVESSTSENVVESSNQENDLVPDEIKIAKTAVLKLNRIETPTPTKNRKVEFVLNRNKSQDPKEYRRSLKANPGIPFSAEKKPIQGVLKASPFPSPVNPFVKRSKRTKRLSF